MGPNQRPTDGFAVLDVLSPISQAASTVNGAWVSLANFQRACATLFTGVLGASATADFKLQQATDGSGTGAKDITGKALTQIVKASGDGKTAMINLADTDLDLVNGFNYVRMVLTVGTAASLVGAVLEGFVPRFEPPVDSTASPAINLGSANVVQIVG